MRRLLLFVAALAAFAAVPVQAQRAPAAVPVITGAQTTGGEGGKVYVVTTLADGGPGSLRKAVEKPGPRVVKFAVAGVIRLKKPLRIRESRITIAGETAPSPGITLWGEPVRIWASDTIIRHLRIRVGDGPGYDPEDRDGITILGDETGKAPARNVLIENCSVSWAIDENVSLWFPGISGVTIRNSIIAEGLDNSLHPKGSHSTGLLVGSAARNVLIQGNLFAHNRYRNPVLKGGVTALVVNNLIYDPADSAVHFYNDDQDGPTRASIQGNVIRQGPSTPRVMNLFAAPGPQRGSRIHLADNDADGTRAFERRWPLGAKPLFDPFVDAPPVRPGAEVAVQPSAATVDAVLKGAGARPWDRDATDKRLVSEVLSRGGRMRDTPPPKEKP
jgi:hypothetical protein